MQAPTTATTARYARTIEVSKRVRWEIERDVIRGRRFDTTTTWMPPGLSLVNELDFLSADDKRLLSQVQGRTYAYMFGLVERSIAAKVIDMSRAHAFGDQTALEALVRMTDEEVKHQELFRRLERMMAEAMPPGHVMTADPDAVAQAVLSKSDWAVLALTLDIELFSQAHYRASIEPQERGRPRRHDHATACGGRAFEPRMKAARSGSPKVRRRRRRPHAGAAALRAALRRSTSSGADRRRCRRGTRRARGLTCS